MSKEKAKRPVICPESCPFYLVDCQLQKQINANYFSRPRRKSESERLEKLCKENPELVLAYCNKLFTMS